MPYDTFGHWYDDYSTSWNITSSATTAPFIPPLKYSYENEFEHKTPVPVLKPAEAWLESELEDVMSVGRRERVLA